MICASRIPLFCRSVDIPIMACAWSEIALEIACILAWMSPKCSVRPFRSFCFWFPVDSGLLLIRRSPAFSFQELLNEDFATLKCIKTCSVRFASCPLTFSELSMVSFYRPISRSVCSSSENSSQTANAAYFACISRAIFLARRKEGGHCGSLVDVLCYRVYRICFWGNPYHSPICHLLYTSCWILGRLLPTGLHRGVQHRRRCWEGS